MNFQLALVTGAGSGLGWELCKLLFEKGIPLLITGRDPQRLAAAARSFSNVVASLPLDLSENRQPLLDLIRHKAPDLVINNAGFGLYGPALLHPLSDQMKILEVNANAAIELSLESARALRSRNKQGVILNVSSTAGELPIPTLALYAASKASLTSFSQSFDAEMRPFGIRVLASLPGPFNTAFAARASNSGFSENSPFAMKKEHVARLIWKQIETKKPVRIIGWRNRFGLRLLQLLPRFLTDKLLQKSLAERYHQQEN